MNDLPSYINYAKSLMFVDDTKCYRTITSPQDKEILQNELNSIVSWSKKWNLSFNPTKSIVISYKPHLETSYNISTTQIVTQAHHKDLGVIFPKTCLGITTTNTFYPGHIEHWVYYVEPLANNIHLKLKGNFI